MGIDTIFEIKCEKCGFNIEINISKHQFYNTHKCLYGDEQTVYLDEELAKQKDWPKDPYIKSSGLA
jgi:hypothetical protein